jgi:N utilization substance protein B
MVVSAQKNREIIFHLLYSFDFSPYEIKEIFPILMNHHKVTKKSLYAAEEEAKQIQAKLVDIDREISATADAYKLERIPHVEKNLLRLGIFELLYCKDIPPKVAMNEAMRLARKFASAESAQFINAILDAIYKKHAV